jgi:uncharacterized iron-regulated membrane protein
MTWARIHRWLAIVLAVLLVVWSLTGLLFHLKPGWRRAYDMPSVERHDRPLAMETLVPIAAIRTSGGEPIDSLELFDSALGPLYRVATTKGTELVDATTGMRSSPLSEASALLLAKDALSRSRERAAYGEPGRVSVTDDDVRIEMSGGPVVLVGRTDARISQRGSDTDRIDWLYRIHYLQWTGNASIDRVLAVVGLVLIWAVMIPGIVLFVRALRRRRSPP